MLSTRHRLNTDLSNQLDLIKVTPNYLKSFVYLQISFIFDNGYLEKTTS
jgi:hypothetical protein